MTVFTETMIDRQPQFADYVHSIDESSSSSNRQDIFPRYGYLQNNEHFRTAFETQQIRSNRQNTDTFDNDNQRRNYSKRKSSASNEHDNIDHKNKIARKDNNDQMESIEAAPNSPAHQPKTNLFQNYGHHCLPRHIVHIPRRVQWFKNNTDYNTTSSKNNDLYRVTTTSAASEKLQKQLDDFGNLPLCPSSIDLLSKLFPEQEEHVLEAILKGCDDDVTSAIECIMPVRDRLEHFTNQLIQSKSQSSSPVVKRKTKE